MYINCHTTFSFRYGTLSPEQLVSEAVEHGIEALALTDINNTSAVFPFVAACRKQGIRPVVGIEFRGHGEGERRFAGGARGPLLYIGLARSSSGFRNLCRFLSDHLVAHEPLPPRPPELDDTVFVFPLPAEEDSAELPSNGYWGVRPEEVRNLQRRPEARYPERMLVWQPVTFADKAGFNTHRLLRAVDHNTLLSKLSPQAQAATNERLRPLAELLEPYRGWPRLVANTLQLLESCSFDVELGTSKNRRTFTGSPYDDKLLLEKLAEDGFRRRYGGSLAVKPGHGQGHGQSRGQGQGQGVGQGPGLGQGQGSSALRHARERVQKELRVIDELGFSPYFLITWDIIRYARGCGFRHVGRGSGANSTVAYCMGITDVDPIELDLYFERFINPHRSSPPDFDIDFSWDERDQVTDYIFKRYGRAHTALLATYSTFKGRSIVRELGKVFGLPKPEIDRLVRRPNAPELQDDVTRLITRYGKRIAEFPNHLSIHAGGVLISEEPIYQYTATEMPPKGFPTTQFDMYVAEDVGLYKYDILSQRGLGHIKEAVDWIAVNRDRRIDIDRVERFKTDPKLNARLREGDTIGCFYIESPAMRQLLRKLECQDYRTLVAASSIIRPGVAKSGMMREYIQRHHAPDSFQYLHPKMQELMEETHGVMVYQEDVIKVAHHFADIDLGDADILRRAMSGKYRSRNGFLQIRDTYFRNCAKRGYPEAIAAEVWRQMESFSGYSFSKAHSASFAVESYQSLYLKAYYPLEFMTAVINNFGGFYSTEFYVNEARQAGADIQAPCVNTGQWRTAIHDRSIVLGFQHVKALERELAQAIVPEREQHGPYAGVEDFIRRLPCSLDQVNLLVRVGAFRATGRSKKRCLWDAALHFGQAAGRSRPPGEALFAPQAKSYTLPPLEHSALEDAYDELELLGFALTPPFDLLAETLPEHVPADRLAEHAGRRVQSIGYLVCTKDVRASSGELMLFGTFLDPAMEVYDTVHFPPSVKRFPLTGRGVYRLRGKVTLDFGVPTLEVHQLERLPWKADPRYTDAPPTRRPDMDHSAQGRRGLGKARQDGQGDGRGEPRQGGQSAAQQDGMAAASGSMPQGQKAENPNSETPMRGARGAPADPLRVRSRRP